MAFTDTRISDWSDTIADNLPLDGSSIGRDLAGQIRNFKSVVRTESWDKEFHKLQYTATGASTGATASITFAVADGDLTSTFTAYRKVVLVIDDSTFIYCAVLTSSFGTYTTVVLTQLDGLVSVGQEYSVYVGVGDVGKDPLPAFCACGSTTITGASTNATVTLAPYGFATADYFVKATPISTNSAVTGAFKVSTLTRNPANFVVGLYAAPGGATQTVVGWVLLRPTVTV